EFGLGESSKFVSAFLDNYLTQSSHLVVEQNREWFENFTANFKLSKNTKVKICNSISKNVKGIETNSYENIDELTDTKFDLYIVDGPIGSAHYSRYDIVELSKAFTSEDDFIIIMDDYNRLGEQETVADLLNMLKERGIQVHKEVYSGSKSVMLITTDRYKYLI